MAQEDTIRIESQSGPYVSAFYVPDPPKTRLGGFEPVGNGQCVAFLQAHGFSEYHGNANEWKQWVDPDAIGWPGDAILLDEGPVDHLALIIGNKNGYNLVEQNYEGIGIVSTRSIPFNYDKIIGIIPRPGL